jgi:hypothetical protein
MSLSEDGRKGPKGCEWNISSSLILLYLKYDYQKGNLNLKKKKLILFIIVTLLVLINDYNNKFLIFYIKLLPEMEGGPIANVVRTWGLFC